MPTALKERPKTKAKTQTARRRTPPTRHVVVDTDQPTSLITFLLDRTGSMGAVKSQTIEAFNSYLGGLKKEREAKIDFTFLQFDSISLDKIYVATPVGEVADLTDATYHPRAGTPLIDACVKTIRAVAESLEHRKDKPKVIICFQTDGEENQSREHTWGELNEIIKQKTLAGWQFLFMGCGIDAYQQGSRMGIGSADTVSYGKSHVHTQAAFMASAQNSAGFSAGRSMNASYSLADKLASGDVFDADIKAAQQAKLDALNLASKR